MTQSQVAIEKENWDAYFEDALNGQDQEHKNQLWWSIVDRDANQIIQALFPGRQSISVLEAGCGTGGTSFSLSDFIPIERLLLVDISSKALRFAQSIEKPCMKGKT